jgi:hypothetical protein
VTLRLHLDAQEKDERMRQRREHQEEEIDAAARHAGTATLQTRTAQRSSGGGSSSRRAGSSGGGDYPSAAFYERQQALVERRKQREAQRRPSDEDELEECVCELLAASSYSKWCRLLAGSRVPACRPGELISLQRCFLMFMLASVVSSSCACGADASQLSSPETSS